ncbi:hypothetical protein NDN01_00875 [Sphingomonas sp. QA11]|uniref:NACHT domain-containing protein n=1 Tax=Sphingomonas sp. QA11 TaxID=2950605 RepID=UPI00234A21C7|nr:hypothetical protein [Sphingomonas sp. QA11]WCM27521.1 hypothetical protein NDN01_00875 [Sphingomonas sp. QA11]
MHCHRNSYADAGEIPTRAALFYDQAFDTLYSRHDTSKGPFRRIHRSGLHKDQFKRAFSLFCFRTLAEHLVSFDNIDLYNHLKRSAELEEIDVEIDELIRDCLESVCLLQRDGGKVHFIHRSFQEFFAANFLANYRGPNQFMIFDKLLSDILASRVPSLLKDLNNQLIEKAWVLPTLDSLIKQIDEASSPIDTILGIASGIQIQDSTGEFIGTVRGKEQIISSRTSALSTLYSNDRFSIDELSFHGIKAFPSNYQDFRDFVRNDRYAPDSLKKQLENEEKAMNQANRERKSMTQHRIVVWNVNLSDDGVKDWLETTSISTVIPKLRFEISKLNADISTRVSERESIDILS